MFTPGKSLSGMSGGAQAFGIDDFSDFQSVASVELASNTFVKIPLDERVSEGQLGGLVGNDFVVPADGFYQAFGYVQHQGDNSAGHRRGFISIDDATELIPTVLQGGMTSSGAAPNIEGVANQAATALLKLTAGQTISLYGWQNSGVTRLVTEGAWLCIIRFGSLPSAGGGGGGGAGVTSVNYQYAEMYINASPSQVDDQDTGVVGADIPANSDVFLNVVFTVNATGRTYALEVGNDNFVAMNNPNVRNADTSEPVTGPGDCTVAAWYDDATGTYHYGIDFDGGGKTLNEVSMRRRTLIAN